MSKIKLTIEIEEDDYNRIKDCPDVYYSLASRAYRAIKYGNRIEECEDCVSRQYIESKVEELENICANAPEEVLNLLADIKNAPPVLPKHEGNTVSEEVYTEEYLQLKKLECEIYFLKKKISELI